MYSEGTTRSRTLTCLNSEGVLLSHLLTGAIFCRKIKSQPDLLVCIYIAICFAKSFFYKMN